MVEETYKFKWKTFEEEMPEPHKSILVRKPKETIKDAQWHFISDDKKMLYMHDLKWRHYISQVKKWLWCYQEDIEKVEEK